jgi:hypothetical protein
LVSSVTVNRGKSRSYRCVSSDVVGDVHHELD